MTGTAASARAAAKSADVPGLTRYFAPTFNAAAMSSIFVTVPTPTTASGTSAAMAVIAPSAAGVRSVTSSTGSPPPTSARASGTASSTCSIVSTGMTEAREMSGNGSRTIVKFSGCHPGRAEGAIRDPYITAVSDEFASIEVQGCRLSRVPRSAGSGGLLRRLACRYAHQSLHCAALAPSLSPLLPPLGQIGDRHQGRRRDDQRQYRGKAEAEHDRGREANPPLCRRRTDTEFAREKFDIDAE